MRNCRLKRYFDDPSTIIDEQNWAVKKHGVCIHQHGVKKKRTIFFLSYRDDPSYNQLFLFNLFSYFWILVTHTYIQEKYIRDWKKKKKYLHEIKLNYANKKITFCDIEKYHKRSPCVQEVHIGYVRLILCKVRGPRRVPWSVWCVLFISRCIMINNGYGLRMATGRSARNIRRGRVPIEYVPAS